MTEAQKNIMFLLGMNIEKLKSAQDILGGVVIAAIPMGAEGASIEVEEDPDTIAFSLMVPMEQAEEIKEFLEQELKILGVRVHKNYEDFERRYLEIHNF